MLEDKIDGNEVDQWREISGTLQQKSMECSIKSKSSLRARYSYGIIFLITNLIAWFVRDYGERALPLLRCKSKFLLFYIVDIAIFLSNIGSSALASNRAA